jgi:hypothetical protein
MANDSRVNLKMLFEMLTDKEIEDLKERAIRQRSFYAANPLRWEAYERSLPDGEANSIAVCALQRRSASCWAAAASWNGANAPVGSHPLDGAND